MKNSNLFLVIFTILLLVAGCNEQYLSGEFGMDESLAPGARTDSPQTPSGLTLVSTCSHVEISWDSVPRTSSYSIYIGDALLVDGLTETNYTHIPENNNLNKYKVVAVNHNGESGVLEGEARKLGIPNKVSGLTASDEDFMTQIVLAWNADVLAEFYRIESSGKIVADSLSVTEYIDLDVTQEPKTYAVIAFSICGEAEPATVTGRIMQGSAPETPANFKASDGTDAYKIVFSWDAVKDVQYYKIIAGDAVIADQLTATSYIYYGGTVEPVEYQLIAYNPFGVAPAATDNGNLAYNYYPNGDFETGSLIRHGWNGTIDLETQDVYQGSYAVSISNSTGGGSYNVPMQLEPGKSYKVSYWGKVVQGSIGNTLPWWTGMTMAFSSPIYNNGASSNQTVFATGLPIKPEYTSFANITYTLVVPNASDPKWVSTPGEKVDVEAGMWGPTWGGRHIVDYIQIIEIIK